MNRKKNMKIYSDHVLLLFAFTKERERKKCSKHNVSCKRKQSIRSVISMPVSELTNTVVVVAEDLHIPDESLK